MLAAAEVAPPLGGEAGGAPGHGGTSSTFNQVTSWQVGFHGSIILENYNFTVFYYDIYIKAQRPGHSNRVVGSRRGSHLLVSAKLLQ